MKLQQHTAPLTLKKGETTFSFLPSGDVHSFTQNGYLINGFIGTQKEGSANNIYLRVYKPDGIHAYPLLGIRSNSQVHVGADMLVYTGVQDGIDYRVTFFAGGDGVWLWDIELTGHGEQVDLLYGQDIGVGSMGGVLTNELYTAQYLGHVVFESENGYVVASRQNQLQGAGFPYIQQGMLNGKAVRYSTDATQFFGLSYKDTQQPVALTGDLENKNYQFELSYTALQTEKVCLSGTHAMTFYGIFKGNHPDAITSLEYRELAEAAYARFKSTPVDLKSAERVVIRPEFGAPYSSPEMLPSELDSIYPQRKLEETADGQILSFFTADHAHVVTKAKELLVERPHGTILTTLIDTKKVDSNLITTTNYIYGMFNAQTVVGNTSFHKMISASRGLLNILKNHGQRLYIKLDNQYRQLNLPATYEMGMNYSRWLYKVGDDIVTVTVYTVSSAPTVILEVSSRNGIAYDFLLTTQLVMGDAEFQAPVEATETVPGTLMLTPSPEAWGNSPYPNLCYEFTVDGDCKWSDDRIFFADDKPRNGTLLTTYIANRKHFCTAITGWLDGKPASSPNHMAHDFDVEKQLYHAAYSSLNRGFTLTSDSAALQTNIDKLNETAWWYTHNAMVHFAVPHGLEQPGGAAWGTRDVCQGPFEFFLCTQHYELARDILCKIFAHQQHATGEWPQWFMFDRYTANAGECHGDIVFWPLKCVGDYLEATQDISILDEPLAWLDNDKPMKLADHLRRCMDSINERFLDGTGLINYAGGDWDDTLQPADPSMKAHMCSAWTQSLAYQVTHRLGKLLKPANAPFAEAFSALAARIKDAFSSYLIKDGIIAGFAIANDNQSLDFLLHPSDNKTGIHYRLLPMTRSIIAELVDKEQAKHNIDIIHSKLACPDGIRLMDRPTRYTGGVSHFFQRAEQAANVGREISLQYTHAHIRYIEAMAKLGETDRAWDALFTINPIGIVDAVPNAMRRQSNLYFSSSEGAFADRYEYDKGFEQLFDGSIKVKGGWRLYSSGPGIYLNQLISNVLGLRFLPDSIEVDPALPQKTDGMKLNLTCFGTECTFVFCKATAEKQGIYRQNKRLDCTSAAPNPYRQSGYIISRDQLTSESGDIEIYI